MASGRSASSLQIFKVSSQSIATTLMENRWSRLGSRGLFYCLDYFGTLKLTWSGPSYCNLTIVRPGFKSNLNHVAGMRNRGSEVTWSRLIRWSVWCRQSPLGVSTPRWLGFIKPPVFIPEFWAANCRRNASVVRDDYGLAWREGWMTLWLRRSSRPPALCSYRSENQGLENGAHSLLWGSFPSFKDVSPDC